VAKAPFFVKIQLLRKIFNERSIMANCTPNSLSFSGLKGRKVEAEFSATPITSDGGGILLRSADARIKLTDRAAKSLTDNRRKASCRHSVATMLKQRVYGLALGYEDLNDHDVLRHDPALQTFVGRDVELASSPTLCRF